MICAANRAYVNANAQSGKGASFPHQRSRSDHDFRQVCRHVDDGRGARRRGRREHHCDLRPAVQILERCGAMLEWIACLVGEKGAGWLPDSHKRVVAPVGVRPAQASREHLYRLPGPRSRAAEPSHHGEDFGSFSELIGKADSGSSTPCPEPKRNVGVFRPCHLVQGTGEPLAKFNRQRPTL